MDFLAIPICVVLVLLGLWHVHWAFGGTLGKAAAIPELNGTAIFAPSRTSTLAVAGALLCAAALVAVLGGLIAAPVALAPLVWLAYGLAAIFALRALGEFRLLGFFKRVRGTRFATMDSFVYAPLCLVFAVGIFATAWFSQG